MATKIAQRKSPVTSHVTQMLNEILKPKSLDELWVMNDRKFPFKAVKIVHDTTGLTSDLVNKYGCQEHPIGTTITIAMDGGDNEACFRDNNKGYWWAGPKQWRLAE